MRSAPRPAFPAGYDACGRNRRSTLPGRSCVLVCLPAQELGFGQHNLRSGGDIEPRPHAFWFEDHVHRRPAARLKSSLLGLAMADPDLGQGPPRQMTPGLTVSKLQTGISTFRSNPGAALAFLLVLVATPRPRQDRRTGTT